jgi:hypothetical protein
LSKRAGIVVRCQWCWHPALALASSVGIGIDVGIQHWHWHPALVLVLASGVGVGVGVQHWCWHLPPHCRWCCQQVLVTWRQCHIVVVDVGGGQLAVVMSWWLLSLLTPSSVSTTISPHEQWLVGWVVVLCRGGSSVDWCLDDYVIKRNNL